MGGPGAGFFPCRLAGAFAAEAAGEGAGGEDDAGAALPALAALVEFARGGILGAAGFAVLAVSAIEVDRHKPILARLPVIAR